MGCGGSGELDQKLQSVLEPLKAGNIESGRVQNFVKTLMFYYVRVLVSEGKFVTQDDFYRDFAGVATEETRDEVKTFWEIRVDEEKEISERLGEQRGEQRGIMKGQIKTQISNIQDLLTMAYGSSACALCDQVSQITDLEVLRKIFCLVCRPDSLEDTSREIDILLSANPHATDPLKFD